MKKLSVITIVAGLIIISIPLIGQLVTNYLENELIAAWKNGKDISNNKVYMVIYNVTNEIADLFSLDYQKEKIFNTGTEDKSEGTSEIAEILKPESTIKPVSSENKKNQKVIGIIKIPKIDLNLPIVEGVKKQNLRVGIGHFQNTARLGTEGNCALAGHRSYTLGKMFNRLDELAIGDKIIIVTKKGSFVYKVYNKFVVLPKDVYVLNQVKEDNIITLITCTPIKVATHRLIVRARLEK